MRCVCVCEGMSIAQDGVAVSVIVARCGQHAPCCHQILALAAAEYSIPFSQNSLEYLRREVGDANITLEYGVFSPNTPASISMPFERAAR